MADHPATTTNNETGDPGRARVFAAETAAELEHFLDVPARVYASDPDWVPPLREEVAKQLSPENSFATYGEFRAFLAVDGTGVACGRIVAAINRRLLEREGRSIGLFGYFECIEDSAIARQLFEAACAWLRDKGMTAVRGPINLSTHNSCLWLVDGLREQPRIMMPHNPPYYPQFAEANGWQKAKDAYAYDLHFDRPLPDKFAKAHRIALKSGLTFRPIRLKGEGFEADVESLYHLFNEAFAENWSSTPRTLEEFKEEAKSLQTLVDPDIFPIAEDNGKMVGFFMALPDYNQALKHVGGRLNWWGILKFLWFRRQIDRGRVVAICALPQYRRAMLAPALIYLGQTQGTQTGKPYKQAELSWVYEDNLASRHAIEASGGTIVRTYRIYEKPL